MPILVAIIVANLIWQKLIEFLKINQRRNLQITSRSSLSAIPPSPPPIITGKWFSSGTSSDVAYGSSCEAKAGLWQKHTGYVARKEHTIRRKKIMCTCVRMIEDALVRVEDQKPYNVECERQTLYRNKLQPVEDFWRLDVVMHIFIVSVIILHLRCWQPIPQWFMQI